MGWEFVNLFHYRCMHSRSIASGILISSNHCTHSRWIWRSMGVVILLSSYRFTHSKVNLKFQGGWEFWYLPTIVHGNFDIFLPLYTLKGLSEVPRGWDFWYLLTIIHTQCQFELPRGWKFWYLLTIVHTQGQFEVPWGWEFDIFWTLHTLKGQFEVPWVWFFFDIFFRPLHALKGEFEVPWGWEFWYLLPTIVHSKVNVKFHGGGNFDVFLITIAPTQRSIWRSMGVFSYRCTNWRSIWSFMGVGILTSSYHCTRKGQFEVPWGWEIWYLLTGVHTQCQVEGPWGWEFLYLLTIVHKQRFIWSSRGCDFWYLLTIVHIQGQFEIPWGWDLDIFLPLYTFKVNLKFMGFPRVGMRS